MTQEAPACRASIVIATHNRREDLRGLLDSLAAEGAPGTAVEVLVVDDASTDGTPAMLRESFPAVRLLVSETKLGPAAARNLGSRAARGALLLYLDSDGAVAPGWLGEMLAADNGRTVLLGCAVDYEGGRVQGLPRRATFLGKSLRCRPERANTGPSCNLGAPRVCFEAIGGFDEEIPYYFEDSDFCIRARKAGFAFQYLPDAIFRHKGDEMKKGDAVRMQEHNSTYAMLKCYRHAPVSFVLFSVGNGLWLSLRLVLWPLRGRGTDAWRLLRGWGSAYARFLAKRPPRT